VFKSDKQDLPMMLTFESQLIASMVILLSAVMLL